MNQHQPPGVRRIRCTIEYRGSAYAGWQLQPDVPTIQGALEDALSRLLDAPTRIAAAGRTDSAVHATAQEMAFDAPLRWDASSMSRALNAVLPTDIRVFAAREAQRDFHPRFSASGRRYEYFVGTARSALSPHRSGHIWQLGRDVELDALRHASMALLGRRDFSRLSRSGQPERGTRCTIERAVWLRTPLDDLRFEIVADRFLHRMVRYLVAVQIEIAAASRPVRDLRSLLSDGGEALPPRPAPPEGLYLTGVRYADGWNRGPGVPGLWPWAAVTPAGRTD